MAKKYIVDLNEVELSQLQSLIKTGKHKARTIVSTVERTREKFVVGGLTYTLEDRPHPPKPRKLDGKQEAFLVATACSTAPEGRNRAFYAAFSFAIGKSWYR